MPYPEMYMADEGELSAALALRGRCSSTGSTQPLAGTIVERLAASTAMMAAVQLRVLGGAMARVPVDATAFAHRDRRIMANVATLFEDPDEEATHQAWVTGLHDELRQ